MTIAKFHLYDLPLDIFETLLDNIVETIGTVGSARLRLVCKLFDQEIPGALYRSPNFAFPRKSSGTSTIRVLGECILYRTLADGKRHRNLSARLHRILEVVLPDVDPMEETYQNALKTLVVVVADASSAHEPMQLMDCSVNNPLLEETFRSDCLKAAARLGIPQFFDEIIADRTPDNGTWGHPGYAGFSRAFVTSLLAHAAGGGQNALVAKMMHARTTVGSHLALPFLAAIWGGHIDTVSLLLEPKYNYRHARDWLAKQAVVVNRIDIFDLLCEELQLEKNDTQYLVQAADCGHIELVKLCLANGANVNGGRNGLESPLQRAALRGHRKIVQLLLEAGASHTGNTKNWQPLTAAARGGYHEIVADLLAAGAVPVHHFKRSPLVAACRNGHVQVAEVLLDSGLELLYKDGALTVAAGRGFESVVRLLVSRGAGIDGAYSKYHESEPPMKEAMANGHHNVVKVLRELGAKELCARRSKYIPKPQV